MTSPDTDPNLRVITDRSADELAVHFGSYEHAFDSLAVHIVSQAVQLGYVEDIESCRDAAELLTSISATAESVGDTALDDLVGKAAELWADKRTHETFSFGVEIIKTDGHYHIWRPR